MPEAEEANYAFFLVKLPQPVNRYYTLRAACFKKGSNVRQQLKLRVAETTQSDTELDFKYGQLFQFSSTDDQLGDYSIIVINETAMPLFERNTLFLDSIRYRMETYVTTDKLSIPGVYMNPVLGEIKDPLAIVRLGKMRLVEFEVVMENEKNFSFKILEAPDMKLIDLINSNMARNEEVFGYRVVQQNGLNYKQYNALKMAATTNHRVVCIQGAPGTGKTFILAHLLHFLRCWKQQAIVLSPTVESLKKLWQMSEDMIKISEQNTLDKRIIMDNLKFEEAFKKLDRVIEWKKDKEEQKISWDEYKKMTGIYKDTEGGEEIMRGTNFVFAPFGSSFIKKAMRYKSFEPRMIIIDNANNVSEDQLLPAYVQNMRMIIAGDPFQLSPINYTEVRANSAHEVSIIDRIVSNKESFRLITLNEHYRCNEQIVKWSYDTFYKGVLRDKWICRSTLRNYLNINISREKYRRLYNPLVFIDTSTVIDKKERMFTYERLSEDSTHTSVSYENIAEKNFALLHYKNLRKIGVAAKDIAILTCYRGQVNLIRTEMEDMINKGEVDPTSRETTINTIDNVQGLEFDCVIFSMVRSNPMRTMGFVTDPRRMNVLMTRARLQLFFIGNGFMMAQNDEKKIQELFNKFCSTGQRFHPNNISDIHFPLNSKKISNNFGLNFQDFAEWTNDNSMKAFCAQKQNEIRKL